MTIKRQMDELREAAKTHDRQIEGLIRALEAEHKTVGTLAGTVSTLAAAVVRHDDQIEANDRQIKELIRQLQAYLNRLPPQ